MNVFSSEPFLRALADTYFSDRHIEIALHTVEGFDFQLLRIDNRKTITKWPLVDYWEPSAAPPDATGAGIPLRSLARVALTAISVDGRPTNLGEFSPSPFVRFGEFAEWSELEQHVHARSRRVAADSRRRFRRLVREVGAVEIILDNADDAAVDACIRWKASQFRSAARTYRDPRRAAFIRLLRDRGVARVSTLGAGGRVIAVHIGLRDGGRFSSWVPAFDGDYGAYAPGRLLLERVIAAGFARGDAEFDFLVGNEPYKWIYATHTRLVGPLGPQPRIPAAVNRVRRRVRLGRKYRKLRAAVERFGRPGS